jgi:hypothetical protein
MRIKRIKRLKVNSYDFNIIWAKDHNGGHFSFLKREIEIGVLGGHDHNTFMIICHELMEICAIEMNVRLNRPDVDSDYVFVYDHRQHETMMNMFAGLLTQFINQ